jgi:cardiolipin synthase A/B
MPNSHLQSYQLYDNPVEFQSAMLNDIEQAQQFIYLETYKYANDKIGEAFRDALTRKAKHGVKVKVLIDSWGAYVNEVFFAELIRYGGEVRFFKKITFSFDFFTKNHRRNHHKVLVIDNIISYIGSANITGYSLEWRESVLRLKGTISEVLRKTFVDSYKIYQKYIFNKFAYKKTIVHGEFEVVQDLPSIYRQQVKNKCEQLIRKAKKEIIIESPYFLPGYMMRKALVEATDRGVKVKVIMPWHSDMRAVDLLSGKYFMYFYKHQIETVFYTPNNLHAKLLLVDNEVFAIGSPNFDYRSFRYQHEIMLFGRYKGIIAQIRQHIDETLRQSIPFDHVSWMQRPKFDKILGWALIPFRHLF